MNYKLKAVRIIQLKLWRERKLKYFSVHPLLQIQWNIPNYSFNL